MLDVHATIGIARLYVTVTVQPSLLSNIRLEFVPVQRYTWLPISILLMGNNAALKMWVWQLVKDLQMYVLHAQTRILFHSAFLCCKQLSRLATS